MFFYLVFSVLQVQWHLGGHARSAASVLLFSGVTTTFNNQIYFRNLHDVYVVSTETVQIFVKALMPVSNGYI